jgi:hypothetical protein
LKWFFFPLSIDSSQDLSAALVWGERSENLWEQRGFNQRWRQISNGLQNLEWQTFEAFNKGQQLEQNGQVQSALDFYRQALPGNGERVRAAIAVFNATKRDGDFIKANRFVEGLSNLKPQFAVTTTINHNFRLLGYDLNQQTLAWGSDEILVTFYWHRDQPFQEPIYWEKDGWQYFGIEDRLYQIGYVHNILPNGGFERSLTTDMVLPYGYIDVAYDAQFDIDYLKAHHRLLEKSRDGQFTQVAAVVNPKERLNGLMVNPIRMQPGDIYIQAGWMQVGEMGSGSLGGLWRDQNGNDLTYWFLAQDITEQDWQSYCSISTVPESASFFVPLAINRGKGAVYFDNLLLFKLPIPENFGG